MTLAVLGQLCSRHRGKDKDQWSPDPGVWGGEGAAGLSRQEGICAVGSPSFNHHPPPFLAGSS